MEKFSIEIETYYFPDNGHQDNVFKLSGSDLRNRTVGKCAIKTQYSSIEKYLFVDLIDIVKDPMEYPKEQDPRSFVSQKTNRGPLTENWLAEHWAEVMGKPQPTNKNMSLMCAYKLCRVEFRYWGMQTKLEKFIHDTALRKTMQAAHCQAWVWQDEWFGLTMDDIREIERQTQLALKQKMQAIEAAANTSGMEADEKGSINGSGAAFETTPSVKGTTEILSTPVVKEPSDEEDSSEEEENDDDEGGEDNSNAASSFRDNKSKTEYFGKPTILYSSGSKNTLHSPLGSAHSFDLQVSFYVQY